jgi:hypothetical protein
MARADIAVSTMTSMDTDIIGAALRLVSVTKIMPMASIATSYAASTRATAGAGAGSMSAINPYH